MAMLMSFNSCLHLHKIIIQNSYKKIKPGVYLQHNYIKKQ